VDKNRFSSCGQRWSADLFFLPRAKHSKNAPRIHPNADVEHLVRLATVPGSSKRVWPKDATY
jgi:hypothetical protein